MEEREKPAVRFVRFPEGVLTFEAGRRLRDSIVHGLKVQDRPLRIFIYVRLWTMYERLAEKLAGIDPGLLLGMHEDSAWYLDPVAAAVDAEVNVIAPEEIADVWTALGEPPCPHHAAGQDEVMRLAVADQMIEQVVTWLRTEKEKPAAPAA